MIEEQRLLNLGKKQIILNSTNYVSFIVDKINLNEYISNNSAPSEELCVKEELTNISEIDEQTVIKYLLEVMLRHDIITEEEYHTVLYKYS